MDKVTMRPGAIAMLAGGVVLLIASFLDWQSFGAGPISVGANAYDRGLTGFFLLVIALIAIAVAAIGAFAPQVNMPDQILGFTPTQVVMVLGAAAAVISFSLLFAFEGFQIGTILAVLSSAAIVAGAFMEVGATKTRPNPLM